MSMTKLFRTILITSFISVIIGIIAGETLRDTLPTILQEYLNHLDNEEISDNKIFLLLTSSLSLSILLIISIIGLWKFKNWARVLFIIGEFISFVLYPFMDPIVMNPWEAIFNEISIMLEGALIAMMYLSPIKEKFT